MATFQTLQAWIGHNATRYHNLNVLPYALPQALPCIFSEICLVLDHLQRVTTRWFHFFTKVLIYRLFINLTVTRGNAL